MEHTPPAVPVVASARSEQERRAGSFADSPAQALLLGLAITCVQIILLMVFSTASTITQRYLAGAMHWDANWFAGIIESGYSAALPLQSGVLSNLFFFPAYPLSATLLGVFFGFPVHVSLLVASHLAAWAFWTYVLLFFRRWGVSPVLAATGVIILFAHPAAFYLVQAYSESLFLASLLGYVYWLQGERPAWGLAAVHGFLLSATSIMGIPLALYPLTEAVFAGTKALSLRTWVSYLRSPLRVSAIALSGGALFFVFCALRFGQWDLPFHVRTVSWGLTTDWLNVLRSSLYSLYYPSFFQWFTANVSFLSLPLTALPLVLFFCGDWLRAWLTADEGWEKRRTFYLIAFALLYFFLSWQFISVTGERVHMRSTLRFMFPVFVFTCLAAVHALSTRVRRIPVLVLLLGALCAIASLSLQSILHVYFLHDIWVA